MSNPRARRPALYSAAAATLLLPTFLTQTCESGAQLETRTFELQYMSPSEAVEMIRPYVYVDRAGGPGVVTHFDGGITVRETPESLRRIDEVIERYDQPKPSVRLHFQVIEADGFTERDPRIEDVRETLDELFRFEGYRLVTETQMALMEGTSAVQAVPSAGWGDLHGRIEEVRGSGDKGSVTVTVHLEPRVNHGARISTTLAVPVGETVILGSSRSQVDGPTTILTVRTEFVSVTSGP